MPCGEQPLPVLVHGELPEGYVVEALEDLQVSAAELPRGTLRRDSLLLNGAVHFGLDVRAHCGAADGHRVP